VSDALLSGAARRLAAAGIDNPRLDARLLMAHAHGDSTLFESLVARRAGREPLAYITGHKEFWSLDFEVGPGVLVPRPETETIIEQAFARFPDHSLPLRVLDFGTGTGCLLISFLKEYPNAYGLGLEISDEARAYALRNVTRHGLGARGEIRAGGWPVTFFGTYDVILSNPPYIRSADIAGLEPEVRLHEPSLALDGGPDGLVAYRALAHEIERVMVPGGCALVEIGAGQNEAVSVLFSEAGLELGCIAPDLAGIPRVLTVLARR
jgi:release factor glutamine methyltransferase